MTEREREGKKKASVIKLPVNWKFHWTSRIVGVSNARLKRKQAPKTRGRLQKNCSVTGDHRTNVSPQTPEGRNEIKVATSYKQHPLSRTLLHLDDHANERITVSSLTFASALAKARFPGLGYAAKSWEKFRNQDDGPT